MSGDWAVQRILQGYTILCNLLEHFAIEIDSNRAGGYEARTVGSIYSAHGESPAHAIIKLAATIDRAKGKE